MSSELVRIVRGEGVVPLAWAGGTSKQDYLNLGDALSPVMTALLAGLPVRRVPSRSANPRLVAVGTIGQNIKGGEAWFWGTGCSPRAATSPKAGRFTPDRHLRAHVAATRGPLSAGLLGGGVLATRTFGDPVQLLPRFYRPEIEKRWDLGVILHLSELADRATTCHPKNGIRRYDVPARSREQVRLINTVTPIGVHGLRERIDEILACHRIVSTSLHGLVIAESYGIPCLPIVPAGPPGLAALNLVEGAALDSRVLDLYTGYNRQRISVWRQPPHLTTPWEALIEAVDRVWEPAGLDEEALIAAFPIDLHPLETPPGATIWDHPTIRKLEFAHEVERLQRADASAAEARATTESGEFWTRRLQGWHMASVLEAAPPPRLKLQRQPAVMSPAEERQPSAVPLAWASGTAGAASLNLGDALSPIVVAAVTGLPVRHVAFDSPSERLVAVGTIAHGQRNGTAHVWGAGLDEAVNPEAPGTRWTAPANTALHVHAARGPMTAAAFRRQSIPAPEIFGDPVYFIDRIFALEEVETVYDLGVVVHLSELSADASPVETRPDGGGVPVRSEFVRYHVPEAFAGRIRIIDTRVRPSFDAIRAKLVEIASCRAILSTSLHGLVLADVYGRPNAWFGFRDGGLRSVDPLNPAEQLDHRVRDLYTGQGLGRVPVVHARRDHPSDWDRLIGFTTEIAPRRPDVRALFEAFPGPRAVTWEEAIWPQPRGLVPELA